MSPSTNEFEPGLVAWPDGDFTILNMHDGMIQLWDIKMNLELTLRTIDIATLREYIKSHKRWIDEAERLIDWLV